MTHNNSCHPWAIDPKMKLEIWYGDEGGTVEDVLLRSFGLAVCAADFGQGPVHCGLGQGCIRHVVLLFYDFEVGRAAITQDVPFLLRNLLNLIVAYCTLPCSLFRRFD